MSPTWGSPRDRDNLDPVGSGEKDGPSDSCSRTRMSSPPNRALSPSNHQHSRFLNANASSVRPGRFAQAAATLEADDGSETDIQGDIQLDASIPLRPSVTQHGRRVAFGASLPRPHRGDLNSSDDEVPQSLMIEATPSAKLQAHRSGQRARKTKRPILPVANVSTPPRPVELDEESEGSQDSPLLGTGRRPAPGLTAHDHALWSWVNVYNLDEYLQEVCQRLWDNLIQLKLNQVYAYYQGNGIYSIVLSRGLNLLYVACIHNKKCLLRPIIALWASSFSSRRFSLDVSIINAFLRRVMGVCLM